MAVVNKKNLKLALLVGEPSGDDLAASILTELASLWQKETGGKIELVGVGGKGVEQFAKKHHINFKSLFPYQAIAKLGLLEVLPYIWTIWRLAQKTACHFATAKPDVMLTVDVPAFSKLVAKKLRQTNFEKIHVVAPTIWAWRQGRRFSYAAAFDRLFCLFPFEPKYFSDTQLPCYYIGHPLVRTVALAKKFQKQSIKKSRKRKSKIILLLLGSRVGEVKKHAPILVNWLKQEIANQEILKNSKHAIKYVLLTLPHLVPIIETYFRDLPVIIEIDGTKKWHWFLQSDLAFAAAGTVTLELALAGVPTIVVYKLSSLTAFFMRRLFYIHYVALPNILSTMQGFDAVMPELLQQDLTLNNLNKAKAELEKIGKSKIQKNYQKLLAELKQQSNPAKTAANNIIKLVMSDIRKNRENQQH